jgi:hypothetical protein
MLVDLVLLWLLSSVLSFPGVGFNLISIDGVGAS